MEALLYQYGVDIVFSGHVRGFMVFIGIDEKKTDSGSYRLIK